MRKSYYSDYVNHMLRFYFSQPSEPKHFKSHTDKINYQVCKEVLKNKTPSEIKLIKDNACSGLWVVTLAQLHSISQDTAYNILNKTLKEIAKKRNLI